MAIQTLHEGKRGCGFRQPGGLYLVTDGRGERCSKLPIVLRVCPTCGHGFAPARGWTWIEPIKLVDSGEHDSKAHSKRCPLTKGIQRAGLLWIGGQHYTPDTFAAEAAAMGVSRRIPAVPNDFELGKTWVLCAHRSAEWDPCPRCGDKPTPDADCEDCNGYGKVSVPAIFYMFKPKRIEYVVKDDDDQDMLDRMEKRGITPVRVVPVDAQTELEVT